MNRDNIDAISEALGEYYSEFQNTIEQYAIYQLSKKLDEPTNWKKYQLSQLKEFQNAIDVLVEQFKKKIKAPIERAFKEVYKDAKEEVKDTREDVKEEKETTSNTGMLLLPINVEKSIKKYTKQVNGSIDVLQKNVIREYKATINAISKVKLYSGSFLYAEVENAMKKGIKDMTVTYRDGRKISFKAYQEMNVRTTMHQEALDYQFESAREFGVVFYLCSSHSDCANDHAKYQGKLYYDDNWKNVAPKEQHSAISQFINSQKLSSIQKVRDGKPYLTTRPNCRHTFKPLTLNQVLNNSVNDLLKEHKLIKGNYDSQNYKNLQYQRKMERQIRSAKQEVDSLKLELKNSKTPELTKDIQTKLNQKKSLVHKYQRELNTFVKSHTNLKRDYRREDYKTIVQDVGYKYNKDKK